jgi:DNA-binding NtrC family response regulator
MDAMSFTRDNTVQFGRRRAVPRVCVVDAKPHIRRFLADTLQELGFVTRECGRLTELSEVLADFQPDLVVLGLLKPESEVTKALQVMMAARFAGRVMLFGGRASTALMGLQELGEQVGLAMLPPLATPFRDRAMKIFRRFCRSRTRPPSTSTSRRRWRTTGSSFGISRRSTCAR